MQNLHSVDFVEETEGLRIAQAQGRFIGASLENGAASLRFSKNRIS